MSMMLHRHKKRIREEKSSLAPAPVIEEEVKQEESAQYSKSEINRMAVDDLRKIATENGVEDAENTSGADLKKILIEKFGL